MNRADKAFQVIALVLCITFIVIVGCAQSDTYVPDEPAAPVVPEISLEEQRTEAIANLEMYQSKFSEMEKAFNEEIDQLERECKDMKVTSDVESQIDSYISKRKDSLSKLKEKKGIISDTLREVKYGSAEDGVILPSDELMENLKDIVDVYEKTDFSLMVNLCKDNQLKVFQIGDEVEAGNFKWKVTNIKHKSFVGEYMMGTLLGEEANGEFLIINFEVTNVADSPKTLSDQLVRLFDSQGREYMSSTSAVFYEDAQGSIFYTTLNPSLTKKATLVFDVVPEIKYELRVYPNVASTSYSVVETLF